MTTMLRRCLRSFAALAPVAVLLLAACHGGAITVPHDAGSPTGGLRLQLWVARTDTRQYEFFRIAADGTLDFAGGMKAFDREIEWTGRLSAEDAARVRAIVDRAQWCSDKEPGKQTAKTPVAEIVVGNESETRAFTIRGPDESVLQITEILSKAANRRFDRFMERLPDAGTQPKR